MIEQFKKLNSPGIDYEWSFLRFSRGATLYYRLRKIKKSVLYYCYFRDLSRDSSGTSITSNKKYVLFIFQKKLAVLIKFLIIFYFKF